MKQRLLLITTMTDRSRPTQEAALRPFADGLMALDPDLVVDFVAVQELLFAVTDEGQTSVSWQGRELAEHYDVLLLRNTNTYIDYAQALLLYSQFRELRIINAQTLDASFYGKVSQGFLFANHGIPTPPLLSSPSNATLLAHLQTHGGSYPMVIKHHLGIKGLDNHAVHNADELGAVLADLKEGFVAQPLIANDGELRILTFGTQAPLIFKKTAEANGSHLNNTSRGAQAEVVDPADVDQAIMTAAASITELMGRDITGIDVLLARDGSWSVLEANLTPALASGSFLEAKRQAFLRYLTDGEVA